MRVGGSQGKPLFWMARGASLDKFLLLSVALTQHTSGLVQSAPSRVGLRRYKAYVLMEQSICWLLYLVARKGYRDSVMCQERCTFLLETGTHRKLWTGNNPHPSTLSQDLSVPPLCSWRNVGLPCGCKCLIFYSLQTSAGCV